MGTNRKQEGPVQLPRNSEHVRAIEFLMCGKTKSGANSFVSLRMVGCPWKPLSHPNATRITVRPLFHTRSFFRFFMLFAYFGRSKWPLHRHSRKRILLTPRLQLCLPQMMRPLQSQRHVLRCSLTARQEWLTSRQL
jgi:hypothetical protein